MSFQYPTSSPKLSSSLNEHYGREVELFNDEGATEAFTIKLEFTWGDIAYVALQSAAMVAEDEVEFMRVIVEGDDIQLESIADEDEWEAVSEAYDDLMFTDEERP
ncbi:DUF1292 domain-containing protein [Paenibacillus sp. FSL W7-1287]|uniref:DUF1292 domain-containing protein n=1 Tax=Paenibacillus sp. FSL W7-1287 TaxID=2954538 RepID=UPI0030F5789F